MNGITVHDFTTGTDSDPWRKAFEGADIHTLFEGLFAVLPGSDVAMIEEENSGRLLFAHADGRVLAEFINKGKDGKSYRMGWSRYLTEAAGDAALSGLGGTCNGG